MDFRDLLKYLTQQNGGGDCNCDGCRVERGEGKWVKARDMTASELDEWVSIQAETALHQKTHDQLMRNLERLSLRKKLFWLRADPNMDYGSMCVDVEKGHLLKPSFEDNKDG